MTNNIKSLFTSCAQSIYQITFTFVDDDQFPFDGFLYPSFSIV